MIIINYLDLFVIKNIFNLNLIIIINHQHGRLSFITSQPEN